MTVHSHIQKLASASLHRMLSDIQQAADAELADEARRQEEQRVAYAAQQLRRKEQARKTLRAHRRRRARARLGLSSLFELCQLPELVELAKILPRYQHLSQDDSGFQYYYAGDDLEYTQVLLYPDKIVVDYGGAAPNSEGSIEFLATHTPEQLNEGLDQIASFGRFRPLEIIDLFGTEKGFSPDLDAVAYQVLIDATSPRLLRKYFGRAINRTTEH